MTTGHVHPAPRSWLHVGLCLSTLSIMFAGLACGGLDADRDAVQHGDAGDEAPTRIVVRIVSPEPGVVVISPVIVILAADGVAIVPAALRQRGAGHFALAVDYARKTFLVGRPLGRDKESEGIYHVSGDSVDLDLNPGEHTITAGIADNADHLFGGVEFAEITFTVEGDPDR